ncbi:hypothetical protein PVAP13_8NG131001 [Panicum virgatum]|uniref:Uncharacterized protein n=1 Tax=Panicum virgatum TaxID=38727 RepID=A0A8T0PCN9_PANVG|nr:hypothetical protein PVAP13_8NG131001 [Panicum virgatum]
MFNLMIWLLVSLFSFGVHLDLFWIYSSRAVCVWQQPQQPHVKSQLA